jgi:hypothetical protein
MRAKTFTVVGSTGGVTVSPAFVVDQGNNPINIGVGVVVSGNNSIADVQHTFADVGAVNVNAAVSAVAWADNATLVSATQNGQKNGAWDTNYAFAPSAIRLKVRALSSAGAGERATITIIQAGPGE